jgi:Rod binding domain-containing protein
MTPLASLTPYQAAIPKIEASNPKLVKAAKSFESMFISEMTGYMFQGISTEAPFGGGFAEETYRSLWVSAMADQMTAKQGLGLSDALQKSFLRFQEKGA